MKDSLAALRTDMEGSGMSKGQIDKVLKDAREVANADMPSDLRDAM